MNILLFGKTGQVGWELQRSLACIGVVTAPGRSGIPCGDLADPQGVATTIRQLRPDVVVNAAAYTDVDRAEREPLLARTVNALAPGAMALAAHEVGARMVHYSTDYVFDGSGQRPWFETDLPAPLNVYGTTKLEGERRVASGCARHLIFRTSWVYSGKEGNFARKILGLALERDSLQVVDDQIGAPTPADLIADITASALRDAPGMEGIYHLAARGETSWYGYARLVVQAATSAGLPVRAGLDALTPVPSSAYPAAARRPLNSRLDTARLRAAMTVELPDWRDGINRMLGKTFREVLQ
ncbi:MAG: dTDP-4-dehydrorhamnose reductase [Ramlibacter sp.]